MKCVKDLCVSGKIINAISEIMRMCIQADAHQVKEAIVLVYTYILFYTLLCAADAAVYEIIFTPTRCVRCAHPVKLNISKVN